MKGGGSGGGAGGRVAELAVGHYSLDKHKLPSPFPY